MKKTTFVSDETMILTIPIGSLKGAREGQLMPDKFYCVFKDAYKVFVQKGKPKALGAAQVITGVFLLVLGLGFETDNLMRISTIPSVLFMVCGMFTFAAGHFPNMLVTKLSFFLNITSFIWAITACCLCIISFVNNEWPKLHRGVNALIMGLLALQDVIAIYLMYWLSKAVCREHFNSLPTVLLKQGD